MNEVPQLNHDELVRLECLREVSKMSRSDQTAEQIVEAASKFEDFVQGGTNG